MSMRNPQNERYTVEREGRSQGGSKPRAASAKPASKAAASVRTTSKPKPKNAKQRAMAEMNMSKEEKRAIRAKEREADNIAYTAVDILTRKDEKYKKLRRTWWVLLVLAVVFTVLSWATMTMNVPMAVNVAALILAYAAIIGALVMDFTVVRKCRNKHRDKVAAMTRKQQERLILEEQTLAAARDAAKKAKKEAKKAGKSAAEAEAAAQAASDAVLAGKPVAQDGEDEATKPEPEPAKKAKAAPEPLTPEQERLAAAEKVARDFANSKR